MNLVSIFKHNLLTNPYVTIIDSIFHAGSGWKCAKACYERRRAKQPYIFWPKQLAATGISHGGWVSAFVQRGAAQRGREPCTRYGHWPPRRAPATTPPSGDSSLAIFAQTLHRSAVLCQSMLTYKKIT